MKNYTITKISKNINESIVANTSTPIIALEVITAQTSLKPIGLAYIQCNNSNILQPINNSDITTTHPANDVMAAICKNNNNEIIVLLYIANSIDITPIVKYNKIENDISANLHPQYRANMLIIKPDIALLHELLDYVYSNFEKFISEEIIQNFF